MLEPVFDFQHLFTTIHTCLKIDMMWAMQLACYLVFNKASLFSESCARRIFRLDLLILLFGTAMLTLLRYKVMPLASCHPIVQLGYE